MSLPKTSFTSKVYLKLLRLLSFANLQWNRRCFLPHNCCIMSCILLYPLIGSIVEVEIEFCHINIFNSPTQQTNIRIFFQDYKPIAAFNKHLLQILKGFKWLIYDNPKWQGANLQIQIFYTDMTCSHFVEIRFCHQAQEAGNPRMLT